MRSLIACLLLPSLALADPGARPRLPATFEIPAYVGPLKLIDGLSLPPGEVRKDGVDVCYDPDALRRVAMGLDLGEPMSDDRATDAWRSGWLAADGSWSVRFDQERTTRIKAEAKVEVLEAAAAEAEPATWAVVLERAGWVAGGALAGVITALLIGNGG